MKPSSGEIDEDVDQTKRPVSIGFDQNHKASVVKSRKITQRPVTSDKEDLFHLAFGAGDTMQRNIDMKPLP